MNTVVFLLNDFVSTKKRANKEIERLFLLNEEPKNDLHSMKKQWLIIFSLKPSKHVLVRTPLTKQKVLFLLQNVAIFGSLATINKPVFFLNQTYNLCISLVLCFHTITN